MRLLASLLPGLAGIDSPKTYAAYPVWANSTTLELTWPTVVKEAVVRWYHQARSWNAAKQAARRYGGTLGSSCMRVLESLMFDFQNYRTGQLDPSYAGLAAKTGLGRSTVALALVRLRSFRIIDWVRRCEKRWNNGRLTLRQHTNAYVLRPPSQWLGMDPQPSEPRYLSQVPGGIIRLSPTRSTRRLRIGETAAVSRVPSLSLKRTRPTPSRARLSGCSVRFSPGRRPISP